MEINFSKRLNELFKKRSVSVSEITIRTGIPESTLEQYISRNNHPYQPDLKLLASVFNVTEKWLLGLDEDNSVKILHTMSDGRVLTDITGHEVPLNEKTEAAYRLLSERKENRTA